MCKRINEKEVKIIELEILDYVTKLCTNLNLTYYLMWGTLIGAVRHQGYIPWDDDVDIAMPRDDYEKLIDYFISNEKEEDLYKLYSVRNRKDYFYSVSRIINSKTIIRDIHKSKIIQDKGGVFIDIYPLDNAGNTYKLANRFLNKQKRLYMLKTLAHCNTFIPAKTSCILSIIKYPVYKITRLIGEDYFNKKLDINSNNMQKKESKYLCVWAGSGNSSNGQVIWDKEWFKNSKQVKFEDKCFNIPVEYDKVLTTTYGNYMKVPPIDDQVGHHFYEAYYK